MTSSQKPASRNPRRIIAGLAASLGATMALTLGVSAPAHADTVSLFDCYADIFSGQDYVHFTTTNITGSGISNADFCYKNSSYQALNLTGAISFWSGNNTGHFTTLDFFGNRRIYNFGRDQSIEGLGQVTITFLTIW